MASVNDFPARGRVLGVVDGVLVLNPAGTNYELRLETRGDVSGLAPGQMVEGVIRVRARKVWTVAAGGNFIAPIFGPPRTLQGRVRFVEGSEMVLHAGVPVAVALPSDPSALDLVHGPLAARGLANVTAFPGATFELLEAAAAVRAGVRSDTKP